MRGSDPDAAVYYLAAMLDGGDAYSWRRRHPRRSRRLVVSPTNASSWAVAAANAVEHVGLPEAQLNLAQAAIYLALAPKSNAATTALAEARETSASGATSGRRKPFAAPVIRASDRWAMGRATYPTTTSESDST